MRPPRLTWATSPPLSDPAANKPHLPLHVIESNSFAPADAPQDALTCEGGAFEGNLLWLIDEAREGLCGGEGPWSLAEAGDAPFVDYRDDAHWHENDYHLTPAFGGGADEAGIYGGAEGGRGVGAVASLCLPLSEAPSGAILEPTGSQRGRLDRRDAGRHLSGDAAPRQDVYFLWVAPESEVSIQVDAAAFEPQLVLFDPSFLLPLESREAMNTARCGADEAVALSTVDGDGASHQASLHFAPTQSGYYTLLVTGAHAESGAEELGDYTISWALR